MESEEAIMENENNSNLESQSNIRDRDQQLQTNEGFGAPYLVQPQDAAFAEAVWGERDESIPVSNLATDLIETPDTNTTHQEVTGDKISELSDNVFNVEQSTENISSITKSANRETYIPDYEEFIAGDAVPSSEINVQSRYSDNCSNLLGVGETQEYINESSNSRFEEEMEVDISRLQSVENVALTECSEITNRDEQVDITESNYDLQPSHEQTFTSNPETSHPESGLFEFDEQSGQASFKSNMIPSSGKDDENNIDLFENDSIDFISSADHISKEEMQNQDTAISNLSGGEESLAKGVCEDEDQEVISDEFVARSLSGEPQEQGICEQSTPDPDTISSHSEAERLVTSPHNESEVLNDEEFSIDNVSHNTPLPPHSTNNMHDRTFEKDFEESQEAVLYPDSIDSIDEYGSVAFDKTASDGNVTYNLGTESSRDDDSDVARNIGVVECSGDYIVNANLTDAHSIVSGSEAKANDDVNKDITDNEVIENFSVADDNTEDVSAVNTGDDVLSFHDDELQVEDSDGDVIHQKPEHVDNGVNIEPINSDQFPHMTGSESSDPADYIKQSEYLESEKDVEDNMEDTTENNEIESDLASHPLDSIAQNDTQAVESVEETSQMIDMSGSASLHISSQEHQQYVDNTSQDTIISNEEIQENEENSNLPDCTTLTEELEHSDDGKKMNSSEALIAEGCIKSEVDFLQQLDKKDSHLDMGDQKDIERVEESMDSSVETKQLDDKSFKEENSSNVETQSDNKPELDVPIDEKLNEAVSDSNKISNENKLVTKGNEIKTLPKKFKSAGGDKNVILKLKIAAQLTEKSNKKQKSEENVGGSSISNLPSTKIKTESHKRIRKNSKKQNAAANVNEVKENSVTQIKKDPVVPKPVRQGPHRAKRASFFKDEAYDFDVDDEVKIPVKPETLKSKAAENGLDGKGTFADQQYVLLTNDDKPSVAATSKESTKSKSSKSKLQTCLVCQKICKCKYNIVRNGDVKHLCDDACFKQFRKTPSAFLKSNESAKPTKKASKIAPQPATTGKNSQSVNKQDVASRQNNNYKTCAVCQLLNLNTSEPFCNWKGLDFCGESCLGKFQANLNTSCSFCHAYLPIDMRAMCCIKIGNDMRPFCKQRCYNEFKKKLRMCAFCQRDVAGVSGAFTAMVGAEGKFKEFCSQACMKRLENEVTELQIHPEKGNLKLETINCTVCRKRSPLQFRVVHQGKESKLCSETCLSVFKYTNKINQDTCDNCHTTCTAEEAQAHFVSYEGIMKHFCGDNCASLFRKSNSKVIQCDWCTTKKLNFDMIERKDVDSGGLQMFCSLNCLMLHRVNIQAKSGQAVSCDQCRKVEPAQYHLTMSDASVRNFCSYSCVMTFQSHFTNKYASPTGGPTAVVPTQHPPQKVEPTMQQQPQTPMSRFKRERINTRQATAKQSPTVPVISQVVSLANPSANDKSSPTVQLTPQSLSSAAPASPLPSPPAGTLTATATSGSVMKSADGKHQIIIQAAPVKSGKNKSAQCRPVTQTKSTLCRPNTQTRETQTDEMPPKCIMIPVPVPIYLPMPTVMYAAPAPKLLPFPIPIPVPIFIPTTRKSVSGISKAIQDIVERIPADPLEAELLMMAEAVALDRRPGDSESESEPEAGEDFGVSVEEVVIRPTQREDESMMMRKREGQGEEDMIQMALRMAEEMSGPIEDLETSVEPVVVGSDAPIHSYETQVNDDYIPSRPSIHRGTKRPNRGRPLVPRVKRQRMDQSYNEDDSIQSDQSSQLQTMEPPADVNYHLKFTYGVNAWRHWIIAKNAQIEKTRQMTGSYRLRPFTTDILKCTTEELNFTLCMFIREVRKPNGEEYSPDSIYYLCLGIQQYLYENNRIDNIFTDMYFEKFTNSLTELLKTLQPKVNSQGQMLCRIEEEHLWESKQLGAHSPFILLNTLIYFHTKHFILKTAQEHLSLSFAQILKHWKKGMMPVKGPSPTGGKNVALRFYCLANGKKDGLAARRNKDGVPVYEVTENLENPLRCPVKLYEFFLSKCPESIKNRNDIFYPVPERSCVPDSPVWYSTQSIDIHTMDKMLTRVLLVREIQEAHLHAHPVYM